MLALTAGAPLGKWFKLEFCHVGHIKIGDLVFTGTGRGQQRG